MPLAEQKKKPKDEAEEEAPAPAAAEEEEEDLDFTKKKKARCPPAARPKPQGARNPGSDPWLGPSHPGRYFARAQKKKPTDGAEEAPAAAAGDSDDDLDFGKKKVRDRTRSCPAAHF